ncbi:MAG: DUF898 domain-containing protein [Cytophagales bacterium]|nr:DUF898 domain-containing protein [Cytophaga sp.]
MSQKKYATLTSHAQASKLFGILLVNLVLTIVTLGIYHPWAKAKLLQYFYSETEFQGNRFVFHGTGNEMFKAYIKIYVFFSLMIFSLITLGLLKNEALIIVGLIIFYLTIFCLIPYAIHSFLRYRLSRSSWRGIHMGYRGELSALYKIFIKGILLCILTFGVYAPWMVVSLRSYIIKNIRFGSLMFEFNAKGGDLFLLHFIGYLLSVITFGIYIPWYIASILNFEIENTNVIQNEQRFPVKSTIEGGDMFGLKIVNFFILVFTLGLGMPWVVIRNLNYHLTNIHFSTKIDMDALVQSEENYKDATGEDLSDTLDLSIF